MQNKREEELLKQQVLEMMEEEQQPKERRNSQNTKRRKKKKYKALKILSGILLTLLLFVIFLIGTRPGRRILYKIASGFIYNNVDNEDIIQVDNDIDHAEDVQQEKHVTNYLLFGIEKIGGGANTDSMMIATINTKDDSVKLTSLLRDSYVEIPGYKPNKLNAAYSRGGAKLLIETIELNYKIRIDGYVSVDFESFETIVDLLGGVTIELGEKEAKYLNKTNYISNKAYRNVKPGINKLNGNQALGYCRVRKVETLGGIKNDYGRIVRQQRVLTAMYDSYVSKKNLFKLLPIAKDCLGYVKTNLSQKQIEAAIEAVVENKITNVETLRIPYDGAFDAPKKYNGIGYPIVLDWDKNRVKLYEFIFNYSEQEARDALATLGE